MLIIIPLLLLGVQQITVPACFGKEPQSTTAGMAPFDAELFTLGYEVFLANGNPKEAFRLAERAVANLPNDPDWLRRAAQSGEWSGNSVQALDHWFHLATTTGQPEAEDNALRLVRSLGDNRRLKQLLEKRGVDSNPELREYVAACEALGSIEDAISALERQRQGAGRRYALEQLARLYEATGQPDKAIEAHLEGISSYGATAPAILKAASLAYGTRDVLSAYTILTLGKRLPAAEREYWQNLGDLAWTLQDIRTAELAGRHLLETGAGRKEDYQRLILITRDKDTQEAYRLAMAGWKRFGIPDYLNAMLELGIAMKKYDPLVTFLHDAEKAGTLKPQEMDAYYWNLVSQVYRGTNDARTSLHSFQEALKRAPADGELAAGYIWLLLDLDRREELHRTLLEWKGRERRMPVLNDAFGAAHAYLGQYREALGFFQAGYGRKKNDPGWLAAYADILEQSGRSESAFTERLHALQAARQRMQAGDATMTTDTRTLQMDYIRVVMHVTPGDPLNSLMQGVVRNRQDEISRELVAAWALSEQRSDLARLWFWREYARLTRRPRWLELALALEDNDRERIARLLEADLERLPYRDAVEGAVRTGQIPLAETHVFERFQVNDQDHLLDQQLRQLYGSRRGGFGYHLSLMELSGVGFLAQQISLTSALTPRISLGAELGNTDIRHQKTGALGAYPASEQTARLGLIYRHDKGSSELFGGIRDGLSRHAMAGIQGDWKVDHRLTLEMALLAGADAPESVGLRIGGMKDEIRLGLQQGLTPRDILGLRISARNLRDQDYNSLGDGVSVEGDLNHRLLAEWPDTTLRLYGGYHYYGRNGTPTGKARSLMPANADGSWFVPSSFSQAGAGIAVGQEGRSAYIRNWRPFGILDTGWNSTTGIGFHYELGLVGPVFGLDKLEGSFSQENGTFGTSDITSRFDVRYRYYFE
ncbi:tetratricopeptide repeat protein [Pelotalea chapellei]|uniref:Tetratricopeptide repeat protein n=1 Tax=Pelotalea chapellei TaxID=44671 RepID=A0ABS5U862_9BACT|nr:tetratricopeptide repeat protein [Pelotalea chapellei]MBT1071848.1 tetratricopeptide repeat protein [Pelotalea chapellei]